MNKILVITLGILVLTGCSNPQEPTKANFKSAIQDYYSSKPACFDINYAFPHKVEKSDKSRSTFLNELVSLGILSSAESEKEVKVWPNKTSIKPATAYSLTEKGKSIVKPSPKRYWANGVGTRFCFGKYTVIDVIKFSEPTNSFGGIVTKVYFSYKIESIPSWARDSQFLQTRYKGIARSIESEKNPLQGKEFLTLTDEGWFHRSVLKKMEREKS